MNQLKPLFATKVATLFQTLEDKTSTQHSKNIALYGMFNSSYPES